MSDDATQREIEFARVFNFRDVGGYPGDGGRTVRWRRLFRSDTLSGLREEERDRFLGLGIRTVLDLRRRHEIERDGRVPEWDGLAYHNLDPPHPEWEHTPYRDDLDPSRYLADRYHDLAVHGAARLAEALATIAEASAAPMVVHCMAGKDRTGVVCALALSLLGVPDADIDADYARSSAGNQRYVAWARDNGNPDLVMEPWYYSHPGTMQTFLSELRGRHGSVEGYLTGAGLPAGAVTTLRRNLLH